MFMGTTGYRDVNDGLKTDETCGFKNHLPQELDGSSFRHRRVGYRIES
jgi:hypothetical protein